MYSVWRCRSKVEETELISVRFRGEGRGERGEIDFFQTFGEGQRGAKRGKRGKRGTHAPLASQRHRQGKVRYM